MEVIIVSDRRQGASMVAESMAALLTAKPEAVLGLATGSSPEPIYEELARRHAVSLPATGAPEAGEPNRLRTDRLQAFLLDEYVGLPSNHPAAYREVIRRQVQERLGLREDQVAGPDGTAADIPAACRNYEQAIQAAGGVDLQLLGIGGDGHIGFNEPGSSLGSRTRIKTLTAQTRSDNARFFGGRTDDVPTHVLTQGVGTIFEARHLVLVAWGPTKAGAVARGIEGPVTAMVPASVLQFHPHVTVVVDEEAAGRLRLADYYRSVFAAKPAWQGL
jgi:glucosamine-6-phosphate deaminase